MTATSAVEFTTPSGSVAPPGAPQKAHGPRGAVARNVLVYGLGTVLARAVSFLMLPVYTRYLSPADYGILQLLDVAVEVIVLVISAGATSGLQRFYFKASTTEDRHAVLVTGLAVQLTLDGIGAALMLIASPQIHDELLR